MRQKTIIIDLQKLWMKVGTYVWWENKGMYAAYACKNAKMYAYIDLCMFVWLYVCVYVWMHVRMYF